MARDLLEAGISVLVEKPMTPTLEEARELFAIAPALGVVLHVGHVERFNGAVQELRKIVARPILIESRRLGPFVPRVQKDTVVMDLMIHDIDIVLNLIDSKPAALAALGASVHSEVADVATVQIGFDSGAIAIDHRQPGHRGEDPHPGHHPARRLHRARLQRAEHRDPPPGRPGVHD